MSENTAQHAPRLFDLWLKACERDGEEVWTLEGGNGTGIYYLRKPYIVKQYEWWSCIYMVWIDGEHREAFVDRKQAYEYYEARLKERRD